MSRIAIISFYDEEGIVDDSTIYYIKSLRGCVSRLVLVVNGIICDKGKEKLEQVVDEILIRENAGFDAGAYKAVICNSGFIENVWQYDEMILANDTCFGPFIPFEQIFEKMECKGVDFWGIDYVENRVADYLQSYFLVFKSKTFIKLQEYFQKYIDEHEKDINNIYAQFEVGLFYYLKCQKFKFGYYCKSNLEVYKSPNYGLSVGKLPIMKKKSFEKQKYIPDNCIGALKYIFYNYDYDIKLIVDTVQRKYKIAYNLEKEFSNELIEKKYALWIADVDYNTIKDFCLSNKKIYIYGAGILARKLFWIYRFYMDKFCGFIVSDDRLRETYLYNYPIYNVSEIDELNTPILIGLNKENTREVREILRSYTNCLFLFEADCLK